ncbi:nucleic acid-binding, OB-fold protein [Artemisia annua]|uniref:Nucleic acid-binding, OB-fold protein n=1 Tax=Artemisia annua TaxID=35608 RepID=A0A2U1MYD8_ARTAN|nr:nucleic acid-binding, OB-fold protein [Artemisia annua]
MNLLKSGKCKKGVTHKDGQLWCDMCNKPVSYPRPRFRLQVYAMDATGQIVIVMWDETASELTKSSAKALLDELDEVEDDAPLLPNALTNLYNTKHVFEVKSHTYYNYEDFGSFTCTSVSPSNAPTVSELHDVTKVSVDDTPASSSSTLKSPMKRLVRGPEVHSMKGI